MSWTDLPADSSTEWTDWDFARQFAEALCERFRAVAGRQTAARGTLANPYAANSWADGFLAAPPASPADGARYAVAASATGAWVGQDGKLATWSESGAAWSFAAATAGYGYDLPDGSIVYSVSAAWIEGGHWSRIVLYSGTVQSARKNPPDAPTDGHTYAVLASATGPWAAHDNTLATWTAGTPGAWSFATPGPYTTLLTEDGILITYGSQSGGASAWHPWRLQAGDGRTEYRGRTSWYALQKHAENLLSVGPASWADTVNYPGAAAFDGEATIAALTLNAARTEAALEPVDEQLAGGGDAPPFSPLDGRRYGVWRNPTGTWSGHANTIATWTASTSSWAFSTPSADYTVGVTAGGDVTAAPVCPHAWTYDSSTGIWRDHPAGFTRKHPREIHAAGTAGTTGQRARHNDRMTPANLWYYRSLQAAPSATPPASPVTSGVYGIAVGATGAWLGRDGQRAQWTGSAWTFTDTAADWGPWRLAGAETAYMPTGETPSSADIPESRGEWALAWHFLTEAIQSAPPAAPADGQHYAIGYKATGDWAGHDFGIAKWTAGTPGAWSFIATQTSSPATVIRVHKNLRAGSGYYTVAGKTYMRTAAGWADLAGAMMAHDGTAWTLSADQTSPPDTVTTYGRIRRGDYIGPHTFNELAAFLDLFTATRHAVTWNRDPNDDATVIYRTWDSSGAPSYSFATCATTAGPLALAFDDNTSSRNSPWAKVTGLHPGLQAAAEWYFSTNNPGQPFYDFAEGWTTDVYNLWRTDAAAALADPYYSADRFIALTRPTDFPATGQQGYRSNTGDVPAPVLILRWPFTRA